MTVPQLLEVKPLAAFKLWLRYSDGREGIVDLSDLVGKGVFALWNDPDEFTQVRIGPSGELAWRDDIDICPDAMYLRLTGKTPEDLFPRIKELLQHA